MFKAPSFGRSSAAPSERAALLIDHAPASAGVPNGTAAAQGKDDVVRTSVLLTAANFMNGVVGAGIIGLPGAFNEGGFTPSIILSFVVALLSNWSIRLLATLGNAHGASTYEDLCFRAFGPPGFFLVCLFQGLFSFGAMISYLIVFADSMYGALSALTDWEDTIPLLVNRQLLLTIFSVGVLLPLCFLRQYGRLAQLGVLKFVCISFLVATVIYYKTQIQVASKMSDAWRYSEFHASFFPSVGSISFTFVCHHQVFMAWGSLERATGRRFAIVIHLAIIGSFSLCLLMGIFGYLTFFEGTSGDIFNNYASEPNVISAPLLNAARFLLALNMLATYPSEMMVARHTLEALLQRRRRHVRWREAMAGGSGAVHDVAALARLRLADEEDAAASADHWRPRHGCTPSLLQHVGLTSMLFLASLAIALATDNLQGVLEISGAFAAVFLAFVLPAAIRLRLGPNPTDELPLLHRNNAFTWLVLAYGVFSFVTSTGFSLVALVSGQPLIE